MHQADQNPLVHGIKVATITIFILHLFAVFEKNARGPYLTDEKNSPVKAYSIGGMSNRKIARIVFRARGTIIRYLNGVNEKTTVVWKA